MQVDYVIPIITEGYLWQIAPRSTSNSSNEEFNIQQEQRSLDARYVRLIYVMMNDEYLRDRCVNYRIRPVVADDFVARNFSLLHTPIFSCRKALSDLDRMALMLAKARPRRRT